MEFLHANTKRLLDSQPRRRQVHLAPRGSTSSSSAAATPAPTASAPRIRHGARSVVAARDPAAAAAPSARADNPWPQWPKVLKVDYGQEEAKALWGDDPRRYWVLTKRFVGDGERAREGAARSSRWSGRRGRTAASGPSEVPGTERVIPADLVLLALGFVGPEKPLLAAARREARRPRQRLDRREPR